MSKNDGKDYEEFVRKVQQSLIDAENLSEIKTIEVKKNKKISDRSGIEREFDLYWEFRLGGSLYKTIIECKDYNSTISIDKIDALIGKLSDLPDIKPIFATKIGYQSGSANKAKQHGISLLIVREVNDRDWVRNDGTPLIKTIEIYGAAITPPEIIQYNPKIDSNWFELQDKYTEDDLNLLRQLWSNEEIFIIDIASKEKYSMRDMGGRLRFKIKNIQYGRGSYIQEFSNAFLEVKSCDLYLKIKAIEFFYQYSEPIKKKDIIDFSSQVIGIVEDIHTGNKKMVFQDGVVKDS